MTSYPPLHAPTRPDWSCLACAQPWPCQTRKRQLRELFQDNLPGLVSYLIRYLTEAVGELGGLGTTEIMDRFVGWCARPEAADQVDRPDPPTGCRTPNMGPTLRRLPPRRSL